MEAKINELQALQNATNNIGLTIHEKPDRNTSKSPKYYYAAQGQYTVSPNLDYEQMNHFLLGWIRANKFKSKAEKAAPDLLEALSILIEKCLRTADTTLMHEELYNAQQAINKAIN